MLTRRKFVKTASMVSVMPLVGLSKDKPKKPAKKPELPELPEPCDLCRFVEDTIVGSGLLKTYQHVYVLELTIDMILVNIWCAFGPSIYNPHLTFYYRMPSCPIPTESEIVAAFLRARADTKEIILSTMDDYV